MQRIRKTIEICVLFGADILTLFVIFSNHNSCFQFRDTKIWNEKFNQQNISRTERTIFKKFHREVDSKCEGGNFELSIQFCLKQFSHYSTVIKFSCSRSDSHRLFILNPVYALSKFHALSKSLKIYRSSHSKSFGNV